jgi:hypothetical protein
MRRFVTLVALTCTTATAAVMSGAAAALAGGHAGCC